MGCTKSSNQATAQPRLRNDSSLPELDESDDQAVRRYQSQLIKGYTSVNQMGEKKAKMIARSASRLQVGASNFINFNTGSLTDNYEVLEQIGSGSYASVHKVKSLINGEIRACKKISKDITDRDPQANAELMNELNILRTVSHPNLIKTYEFYQDGKYMYMIMELCKGGEFFEYVISNKFGISEAQAVNVISQLFAAVNYMHNIGIIHRDLKLENLLLEKIPKRATQKLTIKVCDFGTGTISDSSSTHKRKIGTALYMAPELIKQKYDSRVDIWSCGIILYILLSGQAPYKDTGTSEQIMHDVLNTEVSYPPKQWEGISTRAKDLVKNMLQKNPNNRISLADALHHPWITQNTKTDIAARKGNKLHLDRLREFNANYKIQQAVAQLIASQFVNQNHTKELRQAFLDIDDNKDGMLSKEEVLNGFGKVFGQTMSTWEVDDIFRKTDTDNSGFIDYDEFITATMDKQKSMNSKNILKAFQLFDKDNSGSISVEELKEVLGPDLAENDVWVDLIKQADADGNGELDLDEFSNMLSAI